MEPTKIAPKRVGPTKKSELDILGSYENRNSRSAKAAAKILKEKSGKCRQPGNGSHEDLHLMINPLDHKHEKATKTHVI